MKQKIIFLLFSLLSLPALAEKDYSWWNEIHGWVPGGPSWRLFLHISPGYLGPNGLPVPEVAKGILSEKKSIELGSGIHFQKGDNAQDLFGKFYYPFANSRIAIEIYGVGIEHYAMSDSVRDARVSRVKSGEGIAFGDLYFATLIQICRDRRFPNTLLRMACKTASGDPLEAVRYSDSPGYFFDLSFSKQYGAEGAWKWLPFASGGFYSWQTSQPEIWQNDAYMYAAGLECSKKNWTVTHSISGYSGYKDELDCPMVYTFDVKKQMKKNVIRVQYLHGFRDWLYNSVKISYVWTW